MSVLPETLQTALAGLVAQIATIRNLCADSRTIGPGDIFLAYPGGLHDGRNHIADALAKGAACVIYEAEGYIWNSAWAAPHLAVANLKAQVGLIASYLYGAPSEHLWMVGVTGTNGKTSVSQWVAQALERAGRRSAVIGTIGNGLVSDKTHAVSEHTTPDAVTLQTLLRDYQQAGATACAMEVSSHGLDQGRVAGIHFDVAVFTNLTRDHLDYHGDMQAYAAAKAKLFDTPGLQAAVINVDDPFGRELANRMAVRPDCRLIRTTCGNQPAELIAGDLAVTAGGVSFRIHGVYGSAVVESDILGAFNISNLMAVIGALIASGVSLTEAAAIVGEQKPVPGRMQTVRAGYSKPLVVIDYAHTPDALEKALSTVAAIVPDNGRLIAVFGCGGDRDRGKRPQMGAIAARYADFTILTSDNPRSEDPAGILMDIEVGIKSGTHHGSHYRAIVDRREAIQAAVAAATARDIVVIAGKGHEDYQIINGSKRHFSDLEEATAALHQWLGAA
ncbi:MAG: UDP-N-acetylmuramoyl-L-alanyl-D-glutamate--2,6-diaminopimelate ligase [Betaproteobacteria bacterium]|nr:UDP-N-acetylmuramoyl-L-alanyl-D-glutamate--2,6-diaminopimelate ligase [Betaproteobacteria bacterium]